MTSCDGAILKLPAEEVCPHNEAHWGWMDSEGEAVGEMLAIKCTGKTYIVAVHSGRNDLFLTH